MDDLTLKALAEAEREWIVSKRRALHRIPEKGFAEFKKGPAVFGNVYKDEDGKYKLLLSEVEMLDGEPGFENSIRGWFKAKMPINEFLETLSEYGAIHHSFLVYDVDIKALEYFGKLVGLGVNKI